MQYKSCFVVAGKPHVRSIHQQASDFGSSDLTNQNGRIFSQRDQIQMPMDEVLTEKVASQQQAEGPLQDMTATCKQCEVTFVFTKGEQQIFEGKKMTQPA